jgi:general secretion pathway protein K
MRQGQERGFALLIVLWSVVLLALLATGLTAAGRSDIQLAGNLRRAAAAEAAADGGVHAAIFHVTDIPPRAWAVDGQPHEVRIGGYTVVVHVLDESGKLNPNYAPPTLLAALLVYAGADAARARSLVQAIADWHALGMREAMTKLYQSAGRPVGPTGDLFRSVDELRLVMGMTPDLVERMKPHLSVFAVSPLQVAHADPVLQGLVRTLDSGAAVPPPARPSVLNITADARAADGSGFVRHAVVSLGEDRSGRVFRILVWDDRS